MNDRRAEPPPPHTTYMHECMSPSWVRIPSPLWCGTANDLEFALLRRLILHLVYRQFSKSVLLAKTDIAIISICGFVFCPNFVTLLQQNLLAKNAPVPFWQDDMTHIIPKCKEFIFNLFAFPLFYFGDFQQSPEREHSGGLLRKGPSLQPALHRGMRHIWHFRFSLWSVLWSLRTENQPCRCVVKFSLHMVWPKRYSASRIIQNSFTLGHFFRIVLSGIWISAVMLRLFHWSTFF